MGVNNSVEQGDAHIEYFILITKWTGSSFELVRLVFVAGHL